MAAGDITPARRIPIPESGDINDAFPLQPGDYLGPVVGYTGDRPAVFFLEPNARDPDAPRRARVLHHVCSPPHVFTEQSDGSLEIRESLSDRPMRGGDSDGWHGYLDAGNVWREV